MKGKEEGCSESETLKPTVIQYRGCMVGMETRETGKHSGVSPTHTHTNTLIHVDIQ